MSELPKTNPWHPENPNGVRKYARKFERKLKLRRGFSEELQNEDDWSFVVKVAALLEASVTELIIYGERNKIRREFLARRSFSEKRGLAIRLGLLEPDHSNAIEQISSIRNQLVHHVKNIDFAFSTYFQKLGKEGTQKAISGLTKIFDKRQRRSQPELTKELSQMVEDDPKHFIWLTTLYLMSHFHGRIALMRAKELKNAARLAFDKKELKILRKYADEMMALAREAEAGK